MEKISFASLAFLLLLMMAACDQDITEPADNSGKIMFCNASSYLSKMMDNGQGGRRTFVLIDDGRPLIDSAGAETSSASPAFTGASSAGMPAVIYFPYTANALTSQYWIRYMRLDAGQHRFRLLDTARNVVLDTLLQLSQKNPVSIFFADTATRFSAMAVEHEEVIVPDKARIKLVNLIPDAAGGGVVVKVAANVPVTDSLPYLASTPYREYPVPEGQRLYLNIYTKMDTLTPLIQSSIAIQAGHSYLLVTKGNTKSFLVRPPSGGLTIVSASPQLDIINTY